MDGLDEKVTPEAKAKWYEGWQAQLRLIRWGWTVAHGILGVAHLAVTVITVDRDEMARRVLTLTINVGSDDQRWLVGHVVAVPGAGHFRVVSVQLDPKLGKTVTLIREEAP